MALQLKFVLREDFSTDQGTLDMLSFNDGFSALEDGFLPAVGQGDRPIDDVVSVMVKGTSHDNLAAITQSLEDYEQYILEYAESDAQKYGVWLRTQLSGEKYARQSFIRALSHRPLSSLYEICTDKEYIARLYQIALKRMPWWEATSPTIYDASTGINATAGTLDYTTYSGSPGAVGGTIPARLALCSFYGISGGGGPLYEFWLGFRTNRYGDRANFVPYWPLEDSGLRDADTPISSDVPSASPKTDADPKSDEYTVTDFSTVATMLRRVTLRVGDITSDYADQRGRFVVLLRARLSDTGTVRVRLADGLYNVKSPTDSNWRVQNRVPITSTSWKLYEMGTVQIPSPGRLVTGASLTRYYAMGVDAECVSGTADLHMDCLILIPADEGMVYANGGQVSYTVGADLNPLYVMHYPDGTAGAVALTDVLGSGLTPFNNGEVSITNGLPVGNGILVLAGQGSSASDVTEEAGVQMKVYQRWRVLRGGET